MQYDQGQFISVKYAATSENFRICSCRSLTPSSTLAVFRTFSFITSEFLDHAYKKQCICLGNSLLKCFYSSPKYRSAGLDILNILQVFTPTNNIQIQRSKDHSHTQQNPLLCPVFLLFLSSDTEVQVNYTQIENCQSFCSAASQAEAIAFLQATRGVRLGPHECTGITWVPPTPAESALEATFPS